VDRQVRGDAGKEVALSLRDRTAERAISAIRHLKVNGTNDVGEAFGFPVAERQGYIRGKFITMSVSLITHGWTKVCGIRDVATARAAASAGASAIGLNFFAKSPRSITPTVAAQIVAAVDTAATQPIGLFVNHSQDEIDSIAAQIGVSAIQLHGDESPQFVAELQKRHPGWSILKAFRIGDSLQPIAEFVTECERLNVRLAGCLLDARVDGSFGGTGVVAPWELIARDYDRTNWPPLILAGGLTPDNVAAAIRTVRPMGVDTASGVESSPGVKDTKLLARFVAEAQHGFTEL
jgi:phosphoribosylanthranilate isomerase